MSDDQFVWSEVAVLHGIDQFERTILPFSPVFARYLQVTVAEVDAIQRAKVAEIQVLGSGVAPAASFISAPLDLGRSAARKIFTTARWDSYVPAGTAINLQFRSSDDGSQWSQWSRSATTSPVLVQVPEPRTFLQYRVNLTSQLEDKSPRLEELTIDFSDQIPASLIRGWVEPNRAVLGRDTLFTYHLELDFNDSDLGVERVRLATPSQVEIDEIIAPAGVDILETAISSNELELILAAPWRQPGTLELRFRGRLLSSLFRFRAQIASPGGAEVQDAEESTQLDPDSGQLRSWQVSASAIDAALLSHVQPVPEIFSPNGDGINDNTVIQFTLARVSEPQAVEIGIYDIQGRLVRRLDTALLSAGQYLRPSAPTAVAPGLWDGRDDNAQLVPPGFYLVQVRIRLAREEVTRVRTVTVVY